uniref:PS_pyruv_trans domain-containing protein n=1 Tax=Dracunculus medinensis TaxID=318479 RepID=A0A0N4UD11_DRAME
LPLKTNREMVRIFKRLNGSFNTEISEYQTERLEKKNKTIPFGIRLFKSSISATFSRKSANFIATDKRVLEILDFLNGTNVPDESFWATIAGNLELGMPYSFNGSKWLEIIHENKNKKQLPNIQTSNLPYYISRYQLWYDKNRCKGKIIFGSCAFGIGDLPILLRRPELVAHKLYLNLEAASFFCLFKKIRDRALDPIENFDDAKYGQLPCAKATRDFSKFKSNTQY